MSFKFTKTVVCSLLILLLSNLDISIPKTQAQVPVKAFPDAQGFGANTEGGRGGRVIYVTNLNNTGAGSFREAVSASGPRTVLFKVAGTISLQGDIVVNNPFLTITGRSAPGEGVQIKGGMIKIQTHDVIIRYLKVRKGNPIGGNPADTDPISLSAQNGVEVYNVIIDHSSLIWGTDIGGASVLTNSHDVTIQDSILGEGLYLSNHPEAVSSQGGHSLALNITQLDTSAWPTRVSIYRNLITSSSDRNPQIMGGQNIDFVNNIVYNWGNRAAYGNPRSLNFVKNYFIKGPASSTTTAWSNRTNPENPSIRPGSIYESGSVLEGITTARGGQSNTYTSTRFSPYSISQELSPQDAYNFIVANVGANRPTRDAADQRIITNLTGRKFVHPNGSAQTRMINSTDLTWPTLSQGTPVVDSDNDGMADSWETQNFGSLSRGSSTNSSSDFDSDGYTDLEEFLNETNPRGSISITPTRTLTRTPTPSITGRNPADANNDGVVDIADLEILAINYLIFTTEGSDKGDFNGDGRVSVLDLEVLITNFGR